LTYGAIRQTERGEVRSPWLDADEAAAYCGRKDGSWARRHLPGHTLRGRTLEIRSGQGHRWKRALYGCAVEMRG